MWTGVVPCAFPYGLSVGCCSSTEVIMVNFKKLKAQTSYADIIKLFELTCTNKGDNFRCRCPLCETEDERSLSITEGEGFTCFASDTKGDQIALTAHLLGLDGNGSMKKAAEYIAAQTDYFKKNKRTTKADVQKNQDHKQKMLEEYHTKLDYKHAHLKAI